MLLKGKIHYVGVHDRTKGLFEGLWPLPFGISYNSYLIDDEKVTLIDTVEISLFPSFLKKIQAILGDRPIDYLIINHMEPDHSGSIALIRKFYPHITIVGNKKTLEMVEGFYQESCGIHEVAEGDRLDIGHHKLRFVLTPMVHWPETMMTYDSTEGVLFSGDAFGCFGALNGSPLDQDINTDCYWREMKRYYSTVVGKYGNPVQNALKKLDSVNIHMICSTHGPVWQKEIARVIAEYDRMSNYYTEEGVVIAYGSMYGHTAEMADAIALELSKQGVRNIVVHDVSHSHLSEILTDVFQYRGLIIGSPTYNGRLYPEVETLFSEIAGRSIKGRIIGTFGTYTWASAINKSMSEWVEKLKFVSAGSTVENKQGISTESLEACRQLAISMAQQLKT